MATVETDDAAPVAGRAWRLPAALPSFGPGAMRAYVLLWSLLLAAAIALPVLGAWFDFRQRAEPGWAALGLVVAGDPAGITIALVHGAEARAAGLRQGDRILAIDGRPAPRGVGADDRVRPWLLGPEGSPKRLTIVSGGSAPRDVLLVRSREIAEARYRDAGLSSTAFLAIVTSSGLAASLLLTVAAILLFRQRRQTVAALLSLGYLGVGGFGMTGGQAIGPLGLWLVAAAVQALSWMCILLALSTMPDGRFTPRWTGWLAVLIVVNGALDLTRLLPDGAATLAYGALTLAAVAVLALRYRALPAGAERQQLRWAFLGFALGSAMLMLGLIVQAAAGVAAGSDPRWAIWSTLIAAPLVTFGLSAYALGLMVSLLRYRLYDADAVIGRSAGYALLTLLLAATFGASAEAIEWFFETGFGRDAGALPGALGAGLAVMLITPMHRLVLGWAERRFQKDLTQLRRDLPEAVADLRETAGLAELLDDVLARIERGVHATGAAVAVDGEVVARRGTGSSESWPTRMSLTIDHQGRPVGMLMLGPRPDGSPVGKDERDTLAALADPIARAIRIVRERERRDAELAAALAALERRISALDRRLGNLVAAARKPGAESGASEWQP